MKKSVYPYLLLALLVSVFSLFSIFTYFTIRNTEIKKVEKEFVSETQEIENKIVESLISYENYISI